MAGHKSPVHIQSNVTYFGNICSSYQEHQIASPWEYFTVLFADFSVGTCALQRKNTATLSIPYKLPHLER